MNSQAIATQIVECVRLRQLMERHGELFLNLLFNDAEVRFCRSRRASTEWFAAFWAAKQCVLRTLGIAPRRDRPWRELTLQVSPEGAMTAALTGGCEERMRQRQIGSFQIATSFTRNYATAFVIAVG